MSDCYSYNTIHPSSIGSYSYKYIICIGIYNFSALYILLVFGWNTMTVIPPKWHYVHIVSHFTLWAYEASQSCSFLPHLPSLHFFPGRFSHLHVRLHFIRPPSPWSLSWSVTKVTVWRRISKTALMSNIHNQCLIIKLSLKLRTFWPQSTNTFPTYHDQNIKVENLYWTLKKPQITSTNEPCLLT